MKKVIAVLNVVAWSGFWAFGYLALSASADSAQMVTALILAALGGAAGLWAWLRLVRISEESGLAKKPRFAVPEQHRMAGEGETN